ncbi:MAG TPA: hypothetical protein VFA33_11675 [Bryobacteraceae bacterium]|nr:hypothetical protein [Bryobacteraceae bacterium]
MRFRPLAARMSLCFLILLGLTSCLARRRLITRNGHAASQPLATADIQGLLRRIAQQFERVRDFSATVDMVPALGSTEKSRITEYKDVRGYILFRQPADIRIIGLYPVVRTTAFDMVSNGTDFRLYIPGKNRFVVGKNDLATSSPNKIENLRPRHFLEAMLIPPLDASHEKPVLENFTDEDNAVYIVHFLRESPDGPLRLDRQVWFDRLSLTLVRQLVFDPLGNILTDARYTQWQSYDGVPFPKHIEINRPQDEYAVVLTIVKMDMNKGVSNDKFVLNQPEGTVLQVLGEKAPTAAQPPSPPPALKPKGRKGRK